MSYGSNSPGGRAEGVGGKPDKGKSDKGGNGKGGNNGDKDGRDKSKNQGSVSPGGSKAEIDKEFGNAGKPGEKSPNASPSQQSAPAIHTNDMGISVQRTPQAQKNLEKAAAEFADQGFLEGLLDFAGFGQVDPATDPEFNAATMDTPNIDVDVLGIGAGIAGLMGGVPLAGQVPEALRQVGILPDDFGKVTVQDPFAPDAPTGYGSLPDGTTVDAPGGGTQDPNTGGDAGAGDPGDNGGGGGNGDFGSAISKPPIKKPTTTPDTDQNTGGLPTVTPTEGLGIDVLTQTGDSSTDVNIRTPEQRRRRGSLGGLGLGGLGI